jgi:hypothetical protein
MEPGALGIDDSSVDGAPDRLEPTQSGTPSPAP